MRRLNSMLYWLGVYALVAAAVLVALLLFYLIAAVSWLALRAIYFFIRTVKNVRPIHAELSRQHWNLIRR
jgi:hypothetical protein